MFDEEVFCFDVFSSFGAGDATILFEGESAHIVLIYDIIQKLCNPGLQGNGVSIECHWIYHARQRVLIR